MDFSLSFEDNIRRNEKIYRIFGDLDLLRERNMLPYEVPGDTLL
jgi:hypothetical protein